MCVKSGMIQARDHIVVVQKVHDSFMIKVSLFHLTQIRVAELFRKYSRNAWSLLLR